MVSPMSHSLDEAILDPGKVQVLTSSRFSAQGVFRGSALHPEPRRAQKPHPIPLGWEQCGHGPRAGQEGHCQASDGDGFPQMFIQLSGFQSLLDAPPLTLENCKGFVPITDGQLSASSGLQSH